MYSYVTEELPKTVFAAFSQLDASRVSITGHSMGGHGALTLVSYTGSYLMFYRRNSWKNIAEDYLTIPSVPP
jgi:S-formylglutathione hydrolase FrmB